MFLFLVDNHLSAWEHTKNSIIYTNGMNGCESSVMWLHGSIGHYTGNSAYDALNSNLCYLV